MICALIAREKFKPELEFQAGTISLVPCTTYVREYRVCRRTRGYAGGLVVGRIHEYVPFVTYVCIAYVPGMAYLWELSYLGVVVVDFLLMK